MVSRLAAAALRLTASSSYRLQPRPLYPSLRPYTTAMAKVDTSSRLSKLRALMEERSVHVYSEFTEPCVRQHD